MTEKEGGQTASFSHQITENMNSIRSFIAIPLTSEIARAAALMTKRLRENGDGIKWVPTDNLHLTLKFLGDVYNTEVPQVCKVVQQICEEHKPFQLKFSGAGGLPSIERARVVHAGVQDFSGRLTQIVTQLEQRLAKLGFKPEPRDYRPHLTLGRSKSRKANDSVIQKIQNEASKELGEMTVEEVQIVASFLDKHGPTYQVMNSVDIG
ncbi:RNA 2',3'-cyclic phosphodiesterase [bacterium]|nr:RNA 2',3'-cyclic phosphodiesterase [bacterium]